MNSLSDKKMRVLFISSRPIYPIKGGDQIRTVQQLELLTERFDVDVLFLQDSKQNNSVKDYNDRIKDEFIFHVPTWKHYLYKLRFLYNSLPMQVNYYYDKGVSGWISRNLHNYDAVFCNNIRTAEYVRKSKGIVKYLDFVDAISMNYDKARKKAGIIKKIIYTIDYKRCRKYEQACLDAFDSCAVISDIDNAYITQWKEEYIQ